MSRILYTSALLLLAQLATAQTPAARKEADRLYAEGDHYRAAVKYEQYLGFRKSTDAAYVPYSPQRTGARAKATDRAEALRRLAECYFRLHDYTQAVRFYELAAGAGAASAADRLNYAVSLRATGRLAEAEAVLRALQADAAAAALAAPVRSELDVLAFNRSEASSMEAPLFTLTKLPGGANKGSGNYAAATLGPDLYFTSSRRDSSKGNVPAWNRLYRISTNDTASGATMIPLSVDDATDLGLASFSPDGKLMVFTAWNRSGGKNIARIYSSRLEGDKWSTPVAFNKQVNAPGSSNTQPCLVQAGSRLLLFFSSDRTGGQGGYDLWYAPVDAANTEYVALNAGPLLNTAGDEAAPFFHRPSGTLVFASNGRTGMGGFDLYGLKAQVDSDVPAFLELPRNLGAPVNSVKDDSYFYSASADSLFRNAYLSSDRASDCCLEIFVVSREYKPRTFKRFVTGIITRCDSSSTRLPAQVEAGSRTVQANSEGVYRLELDAALEGALSLVAALDGYRSGQGTLALMPATSDTTYVVNICLDAPRPRQWEPILFDFDKDLLTGLAKQQLDRVFEDMKNDPSLRVQVDGYTDGKGGEPYNDALAQRRAQAVRDYLWNKGIDAARLEVKGFGECCPLAPERAADGKDAPAARRLNRRVELKSY